jgi:hypothetical protein
MGTCRLFARHPRLLRRLFTLRTGSQETLWPRPLPVETHLLRVPVDPQRPRPAKAQLQTGSGLSHSSTDTTRSLG